MQIALLQWGIKEHKRSKTGEGYFFSNGKLNVKTAVYSA
jgi:hypothetical protein